MDAPGQQVRENTIESIQEAVARLFNLSVEELRHDSCRRAVVVPRQIAMYLTKQMTDASLPEIGRHFGGKHHTTVMHSIAKIYALRRSDPALDHTVGRLLTTLNLR
jgi:chromosomal replication initiator protein